MLSLSVINAALSVSALTSSGRFDLSKTYFLLTGIAGVNPRQATIGSVAFARYVIQADTQMEWDAREIPSSWETGYVPMGAPLPGALPRRLHGSDVFELNDGLREVAMSYAERATLKDSEGAAAHRKSFENAAKGIYNTATQGPKILRGDVLSANVFWHGYHISEGMTKIAKTYTSGKATYVMTAQEDTAILEALRRAALQEQVDFSRIVLMRSGSNFDRGPRVGGEVPKLPFALDYGGLQPSLRNLYLCGVEIATGILNRWEELFEQGIEANNYVGDVYGTLGGEPDFVPAGLAVETGSALLDS